MSKPPDSFFRSEPPESNAGSPQKLTQIVRDAIRRDPKYSVTAVVPAMQAIVDALHAGFEAEGLTGKDIFSFGHLWIASPEKERNVLLISMQSRSENRAGFFIILDPGNRAVKAYKQDPTIDDRGELCENRSLQPVTTGTFDDPGPVVLAATEHVMKSQQPRDLECALRLPRPG